MERDEAVQHMQNGAREMVMGLKEYLEGVFRDITKALAAIDWSALAALKEADPDGWGWKARGPVRRVQLRRARAMKGRVIR